MVIWKIIFSKAASKNSTKIAQHHLRNKVQNLLDIIRRNPYQNPPPYEKLIGDFDDYYSRRINVQHRLVYQVLKDPKIIKVVSMWEHYE